MCIFNTIENFNYRRAVSPPSFLLSFLLSSNLLHVINGAAVMDDNGGGVAGTTGQGRTLPPERPGMARPHAVRLITQPQRWPLIDGLHQAKPPNGGVPSPPYAGPSILSPSQRAGYCIVSSGRGGTDLIPLLPITKKKNRPLQDSIWDAFIC